MAESEVMVCKFDDKIQCVNYACEEDISSLEVTKEECALRARLEIARKVIEKAVKEAKACPQPQDMKTRLTFDFDDWEKLRAALNANRPMEEKKSE
jgi:hypothetical protein